MRSITRLVLVVTNWIAICVSASGAECSQYAESYKNASNSNERLQVAISAINAGVLEVGVSVGVIDEIFGTNYSSTKGHIGRGKFEFGAVDFSPQPKACSDTDTVPYVGWYLGFFIDSDGRLAGYYISNVHKAISPRLDDLRKKT